MRDSEEHIITLDSSIAETVQQAKQALRINARAQMLLRDDAAAYDYCPTKAREQATLEAVDAIAGQESVNSPSVKSN